MQVLAAILSSICPGVGQIYNREIIKGIDLILLQCLLGFLAFSNTPIWSIISILLMSIVWMFGVVDASKITNLLYVGGRDEHIYRRFATLVICLIVVAGIALGFIIWALRNHYLPSEEPSHVAQPKIQHVHRFI